MDCRNVQNKLFLLSEGLLDSDDTIKIKKHTSTCASCSKQLMFYQDIWECVQQDKAVEIAPYLFTRIQGKMQHQLAPKPRWALVPVLATSVLLVGLAFGSLIGNLSIPASTVSVDNQEVSYLFNDMQLERVENKLIND